MPAPTTSAPSVVPVTQPSTQPVASNAEIAADVREQTRHDEPSSLPNSRNAIADASRALREQPRNADGTFAPLPADAEGAAVAAASPAEGAEPIEATETPAEGEEPAGEAESAPEPRIFKLSGEAQRGESDIELDVSDLPPEVIERLERNEKQGMRRREFDDAMRRVAKLEADQAEFETMVRLNPEGVILDHLPPANRLKVGAAILFEHWDEFAPIIHQVWEDPAARMKALQEIKSGAQTVQQQVATQVQTARFVTQITRAINQTIPDGTEAVDASTYRAAAEALVAQELTAGRQVTPEQVPQLLAPLAARYGFADAASQPPAEAPKRPKLAVHSNAQPASAPTSGTRPQAATAASGAAVHPAMTPERFAEQQRARTGAKAVAPQGAGATPVRRPGPPANATIEQASAYLRGTSARR